MQMGYDFNEAMPAGNLSGRMVGPAVWPRPAEAPGGDGELRRPDWPGLRARFLAAQALRRTAPAAQGTRIPAGGFAASGESVLSSCRAAGPVNPVYWANLKDDSAITGSVAASPTRGDRGMA